MVGQAVDPRGCHGTVLPPLGTLGGEGVWQEEVHVHIG